MKVEDLFLHLPFRSPKMRILLSSRNQGRFVCLILEIIALQFPIMVIEMLDKEEVVRALVFP